MTHPIIKIVNAQTGEEVERPMNKQELAEYEVEQAAYLAKLEQQKTAATAKAALLERLGITADEAALLLG